MITVELIDLITEYISLDKAVHTNDHHRLSEEARLHEKWADSFYSRSPSPLWALQLATVQYLSVMVFLLAISLLREH